MVCSSSAQLTLKSVPIPGLTRMEPTVVVRTHSEAQNLKPLLQRDSPVLARPRPAE